jgi:hypothetical protein
MVKCPGWTDAKKTTGKHVQIVRCHLITVPLRIPDFIKVVDQEYRTVM